MIITDENVKYDTDGHYYYLTEAGLIKYTGYEELLELWKNPANRLKTHGRQLHNKYIQSAYNGNIKRFRHRDIIEYSVFKNNNNEREAIIQALTDMIEATYDTDWDRTLFQGEAKWPSIILQPLADVGVYFKGEISFEVPEDEYEVEY